MQEGKDKVKEREVKVLETLNNLNIEFERVEHPEVYTIEEAKKYCDFKAVGCKNLFLKDIKTKNYYLISMIDSKRADLKSIANQISVKKLTFAKAEELNNLLGSYPGEVSPFGLINDSEKEVTFLIDKELENMEKVAFHPNVNSATLLLKYNEFKKFLKIFDIQYKAITI